MIYGHETPNNFLLIILLLWMRQSVHLFARVGPVSTGLYNSIFSGMQASTRAELAGGSKDQQRQLMYQHMTAEGMKPGGIIDQGMNKLSVINKVKMNKTFGEGFEKEVEKTR